MAEQRERKFLGVWIPREIWLSKKLTLQEKVFLAEIESLDNEKGCFASNAYFAEFFDLSKTRVSLVIRSLVKKGCVTSEIHYKEGSKEILKRVLKVCYRPPLTKGKEPIQLKLKENNTVNSTENNKTIIELPLNDGSSFVVDSTFHEELKSLYEKTDILAELKNMKGWLLGNPGKRKTRRGIKRFITSWLQRSNEKNKPVEFAGPEYITDQTDLYGNGC
ncbi:helix-turn-helix domain-containing protein [Maridesulfovibrio sp.]|uniref:helix-turn-helix domain-containing protein n=1 Tax=Maridesulfovibrio sp. TaxID=2795000 RepID=UPI003BAA97A1